MSNVKITITGPEGSGKTTVGAIIYDVLKELNYEIVLSGEDRSISDKKTYENAEKVAGGRTVEIATARTED